jgi:hypothetical protein
VPLQLLIKVPSCSFCLAAVQTVAASNLLLLLLLPAPHLH